MCAIVDANVVSELWESGGTAAGQAFRKAVEQGRVPLVLGGTLSDELSGAGESMRRWLAELQLAGRLVQVDGEQVARRTSELNQVNVDGTAQCSSDDEHVIALALVSGARLLYTNDAALTDDFKDKTLVDAPRGRVYTTRASGDLRGGHRALLRRTDLCSRGAAS